MQGKIMKGVGGFYYISNFRVCQQFSFRLKILNRKGFTHGSGQTEHFCQNKYIRPFRVVNAFRKIIHKKKRPSRQVSFLFCEDFRNATETFRLTLLSYTVSITAKYYISAKIKGQIIYKEKKRKNINIFFRDLHKVRIRGIDFTPNIY